MAAEMKVHGRQIFSVAYSVMLNLSLPCEKGYEPGKVYLTNLPSETEDLELARFLKGFGQLLYCYVVRGKKIKNKIYGFARF